MKLSDDILRNSKHNYGSHAQDAERATKEDWASRAQKLEACASAAQAVTESNNVWIGDWRMDDLREALKELKEE